jgi:hypothetical protein
MYLLSVLLIAQVTCGQPAIKLGLSEEPILQFLSLLENAVHIIPLPNITKNSGSVELELYNVYLNNTFSFPEHSLSILEPCNVTVNLSDFNSVIYFSYIGKDGKLALKGNGTGTFSDNNITFDVGFSTAGGAIVLYIDEDAVVVNISNCVVKSNLPSAINKEIENDINDDIFEVSTLMAVEIGLLPGKINPVLQSVAKLWPIPPLHLMFNISVAEDLRLESGLIVLPINGEALLYPFRAPIGPFVFPALPEFGEGLPLQALISEYYITDVAAAVWSQANITIASLPAGLPIRLTTDGLAFLLPGLKKTFGPGKNVTLIASPSPLYGKPELNVTTVDGGVLIQMGLQLNFYVQTAPNVLSFALTLEQQFTLTAMFSENNYVGSFALTALEFLSLAIPQTAVPVDLPLFTRVLGMLVKTFVPVINALGTDFEIPHSNNSSFYLAENSITLKQGYALLQARLGLRNN